MQRYRFAEDAEAGDENYRCYTFNDPLQIFKQIIKDEDLEEVQLCISTRLQLDSIVDQVESYLRWLTECESVLRNYYEHELGKPVHSTWFDEIEIYRVDLTFNSEQDYGATISCGDSVLQDHILIIDFDKEAVEAIHLNG